MFRVQVDKTALRIIENEVVTSGSSNVYDMEFSFSPDWEGFEKTVVFILNPSEEGSENEGSYNVLLDDTNRCKIPRELMTTPNNVIYFGVFGVKDVNTILPTAIASLTTVRVGVVRGDIIPADPTPSVYQQILSKVSEIYGAIASGMLKGDRGERGFKGDKGDKGDPGPTDHNLLTGRDKKDQHPVSAITGLEEALASIPVAMTAEQLREILTNGGQENG